MTYIAGLLRGDLGKSLLTRRAVSDDLKLPLPGDAGAGDFVRIRHRHLGRLDGHCLRD